MQITAVLTTVETTLDSDVLTNPQTVGGVYQNDNQSDVTHSTSAMISYNSTDETIIAAMETEVRCEKQEILSSVVQSASPYLYPCTVAYCIISSGVLFMLWRRVSWRSSQRAPSPVTTTPSPRGGTPPTPWGGVDCTAANRGLFLGILSLVLVIISMIFYFVLVNKAEFLALSLIILHGTEGVLYLLTLLALAMAACRIRNMCYIRRLDRSKKLEQCLLILALGGLLLLCVFNILAGCRRLRTLEGLLLVGINSLVIVQSLVQTVFILCAMHRSARTVNHAQKKPGREFITFVLIANIAMWGVYTFEVMRMNSNPVAMEVYGYQAWTIVTHVTIPLAIFFRFHSTVCLAAIWSNIYKKSIQG